MLVIADADRPVGLAGVMGGLDTEISAKTTKILIESAQFDPMSIRRTGRGLGLNSPAAYRFERPLDPTRTEWASRRCAELILETAGGTLHPGVIDQKPPIAERPQVTLRLDQIPRVLGITIDRPTVERILTALGLEPTAATSDSLTYQAPSWRSDLEREIDLIEEVARIHGYDHIPENRPVPLARSARGPRERVETEIRNALAGLGLDEACTFSLAASADWDPFPGGGPDVVPLRVEHSTRKREVYLRRSLAPSLLAARASNEAHGVADARLFEIAGVYRPQPDRDLPDEPVRLAIVAGLDFLGLKGVVEALLHRLHVSDPLEARPSNHPMLAPGRQADLHLGGGFLGTIGEVDRDGLAPMGLRNFASLAELSFDLLQTRAVLVPQYHSLPSHPAVERDLSLIVAADLPWSELAEAARSAAGPMLESLTFLDTYQGASLPEGAHSLHFGLRFRQPGRTLTGEEVDHAVRSVADHCASRFGSSLRT